MNNKKEDARGCGCGASFKDELNNIVDEGTKPAKTEHDKKRTEVNAAFNNNKANAHHNNALNVHNEHHNAKNEHREHCDSQKKSSNTHNK